MPFLEQLVQSIDVRIRQLNGEIESLQDARSALVSNGAARPTPAEPPDAPASRPPRATRRRRARRSPPRKANVLLAEAAERTLAESGGMTTAALAEQAGADRDQVLALLRDLEAAQRVRRTGQRRGTRWHTITDEDRIAQRAAELAARSKARAA